MSFLGVHRSWVGELSSPPVLHTPRPPRVSLCPQVREVWRELVGLPSEDPN